MILDGEVPRSVRAPRPTRALGDAGAVAAVETEGRRGGDLPRVLSGVPAAVLLVDLPQGAVVYANPAARRLAPGVTLPVPTDSWGHAAGLQDPAGDPLEETRSPLSRLAQGRPVEGEAVTAGDPRSGRRLLWATGFPLEGAPVLEGKALLVLLEVTGAGGLQGRPDDEWLQQLRDRAVIATELSFTISDPARPDNPLVYVNPAFCRTTGYRSEEVLGRNCRFLQGPRTDPDAVRALRDAIAAEESVSVTLLNHRKDGTAFWNEVSLSPVHDDRGRLVSFVGVQADVTARLEVERQRESALSAERAARAEAEAARAEAERLRASSERALLAAERARQDAERAREAAEVARAEAERAQARLALLAEATTMLTATLDVGEALRRLARLVVPGFADWAAVDLVEGPVRRRVAAAHVDPERADLVLAVADREGGYLDDSGTVVGSVLAGGPGRLLSRVSASDVRAAARLERQQDAYRRLEPRSAIVVPLQVRRRPLGALTLVRTSGGRLFGQADYELAEDLARRAALALENARLYTREHEVAEALQRSLLPELPSVPGLDLAARYLPGGDEAQVGGDWWDVLALPDGATGLAVGDVMGHDMAAAAAMGQLRSVLRSYAWEGDTPSRVLERLDRLVQGLSTARLATVVYARVEPAADDQPPRLCWSNAGHLPPLLQEPDGTVCLLDEGASVLIGAPVSLERDEAARDLPPGSTVLLYTDGLLERRGEDLEEGLDRLRAVVQAHRPEDGSEALCRRVVDDLAGGHLDDDVALLAVRLVP